MPEPSFKFQKLEGAQAEQTVRYALLYDFVATPVAAGGVQIAGLFAPRNPTPSGSTLNFVPRIDTAKKTFDIEVIFSGSGTSAGVGGGGGAGGGGAGSSGGNR